MLQEPIQAMITNLTTNLPSHGPYILCFALICLSLFGLTVARTPFKKLLCLSLLQVGTIIFFITLGKVSGGRIPVLACTSTDASCLDSIVDPVPQVLMLTAIVVGITLLAVGLALAVRMKKEEAGDN